MRSQNRIDLIMTKLTKLWKLYPDLRFCQLLYNVSISIGWKRYNDLFYIEDDKLLEELERRLRMSNT